MPRTGKLEITKDKQSKKWVINISAKLSKTGKKQRLKFSTKVAAEIHRKNLMLTLDSPRLKTFDENLLISAQYYKEIFQLYGFKGLDDACAEFTKQLERQNQSLNLKELIIQYKTSRGSDWSVGYKQTFEWAKKQLADLHNTPIHQLNAQHWHEWLPKWRKKRNYSAKSYNHLRTFLVTIFSLPSAIPAFPTNPIKPIPSAKIKRKEVVVATVEEVKNLLSEAQSNDPQLVPWFAIAFFSGLRPESELGKLDWADINFEEKWIRVGFGNKTDTKRFVDLSDNLTLWLKPYKKSKGRIQQTNHRKRKDKISKNIITWCRDISRHSYGSYLEAQARAEGKDSKSVVLANMGHHTTQTYEQHYRNARTGKEAAKYWAITPE